MRTSIPFQSAPRDPNLLPFLTRGIPDGWHDPWDGDPYDAVLSALRQRNALRRRVTASGADIELLAQARVDGRLEAHVVAGDAPVAHWPSTNGPTVTVALDALEAELREVLGGAGVTPDARH